MNTTMKTLICTLVLLVLFSGAVLAQAPAGKPSPMLLAKIEEGKKAPRINNVPATYVRYKGYLVPKEMIRAQQNGAGTPNAVPLSEEEKRRRLQEQVNKYKAMARSRNLPTNQSP